MFKNIYPLFERKRLLKKEMLEILRDYPRDIFQILYQDYCNFSYRIQIKATSNPYNSLNPLTWSESP